MTELLLTRLLVRQILLTDHAEIARCSCRSALQQLRLRRNAHCSAYRRRVVARQQAALMAAAGGAIVEPFAEAVPLVDRQPDNAGEGRLEVGEPQVLPAREPPRVPPAITLRAKKLLTVALFLEWLRQGVYLEVIGPTLPFLKRQINSDYATVTQALTGWSIGLAVGSVIGMMIEPVWRRSCLMVLIVCIVISACWMAAIPFAPDVALYWVSFLMLGLMQGVIHTFGNPLLMRMWQDQAAGPLQLLYFGLGIGSCIVPLITSLFLLPESKNGRTGSTIVHFANGSCVRLTNFTSNVSLEGHLSVERMTEQNQNSNVSSSVPEENDSDWSLVPYVYILLSAFGAMCACVFGALYFAERRGHLDDFNATSNACAIPCRDLSDIDVKTIVFLLLLSGFSLLLAGANRAFASFIFVYAKEELCFEDSKALSLNSAFWGAFSGGRLTGFFIGSRLHPKYLLNAEVTLMAVCCAVLAFVDGFSEAMTWVFTVAAALFLGPVYPTLIAWINRYFLVTSMTVTLLIACSSAGMAASQALIGKFLAHHSAKVVTYFASGQTAIMALLSAAMQVVAWRIGDRFINRDA